MTTASVKPNKLILRGSTAAAALALAGCGGGGGGGPRPTPAPPAVVSAPEPVPAPVPAPAPAPTPVPPPPAPSSTSFNTDEYRRSNAAVSAGAIAAWQAGATGAGIKIAFVDSGINAALPDFAGRIDPASGDTASNRGITDEGGHGTAVTSIAAAGRDGQATMGVAFGSTILAYRTDVPGSCAMTGVDEGCQHEDSDIAEAVDMARNAGARAINISLGGSPPAQQLVAAVQRATAAGIVIVVSAGNDREKEPAKGDQPDPFAVGLVAGAGNGLVIIAGSVGVDTDGNPRTFTDVDTTKLSLFSNKAGSSLASYLAAQGQSVVAPNIEQNNDLFLFSGTSFSAPVITGAVALLAQAFPNLTGRQIVDLLYRSANDLGVAGDDAEFGQGSLNIARAFQPQGQTSMAGSRAPVSLFDNGSLPSASGDARSAASAVILDEYDRAFAVDLGGTLRAARVAEPLVAALGTTYDSAGVSAGAVSVSMTARREERSLGVGLAFQGLGRQDARRARLVAGGAIARISDQTAIAMGFSEGARALEKRLAGVADAPFMIARDPIGGPGFEARRGDAFAVRQTIGPVGVTVSSENGRVARDGRSLVGSARSYGFTTNMLTADTQVGPARMSMSASRMREGDTVLGGRLATLFGATGATSWFVDGTASADIGAGWLGTMRVRRGWTGFAGGAGAVTSDALGFDLARTSLLRGGDRFGLRIAQPLRVVAGGFAAMLPVGYAYATSTAEFGSTQFNLAPEGREIDFEAAYGVPAAGGWLGLNAFMRRQPGHVRAAADDVGGAVQFSLGF